MINPSDYQDIICLIDTSLTDQQQAFENIRNMRLTLNSMTIVDTRRSLLGFPTDTAVTTLFGQLGATQTMKTFLKALQKHVDSRVGLAIFLNDNGIVIPQQVADLSAQLGYTIPSGSIDACV